MNPSFKVVALILLLTVTVSACKPMPSRDSKASVKKDEKLTHSYSKCSAVYGRMYMATKAEKQTDVTDKLLNISTAYLSRAIEASDKKTAALEMTNEDKKLGALYHQAMKQKTPNIEGYSKLLLSEAKNCRTNYPI